MKLGERKYLVGSRHWITVGRRLSLVSSEAEGSVSLQCFHLRIETIRDLEKCFFAEICLKPMFSASSHAEELFLMVTPRELSLVFAALEVEKERVEELLHRYQMDGSVTQTIHINSRLATQAGFAVLE